MNGNRRRRRVVRMQTTVTLVSVAVIGGVAGFLAAQWLASARPTPRGFEWTQGSRTAPVASVRPLATRDLLRELDLSDVQRATIDSILAEAQSALDLASEPLLARMRVVVSEAHDAVRAELTPEQLERFDELLVGAPIIELRRRPPDR